MKKLIILGCLLISLVTLGQTPTVNSIKYNPLGTPPSAPLQGQKYYDIDGSYYHYDGTNWIPDAGAQDNKERVIYLMGSLRTQESVANAINNQSTFTIEEDEIVTFIFDSSIQNVGGSLYSLRCKILNYGKGTFGRGGTQLVANDILIVSTVGSLLTDIEDSPLTQTINLPTSTGTTVEAVWNAQPDFIVQNQNEGYVLVNITIDDVPLQYLFTGVGGTYGATSGNTSVADDFSFQSGDLNVGVQSLQAGTNITIDDADPANPIINATGGEGLEAIDEGNGIGWRLIGRNAANYGNIGLEAVDLSYNSGSIRGATGQRSFAQGSNTLASGQSSHAQGNVTIASGDMSHAQGTYTTASGQSSHAEGTYTTASGSVSHAQGNNTTASGASSHAGGVNNIAQSYSETAIGLFSTNYIPTSTYAWAGTDRVFNVGNGINAPTRSDALTILKNGNVGIGIDNFEAFTTTAKLNVNGTYRGSTYGSGTNSGTATYGLAVDADGYFIETALGGGNYIPLTGTEVGSPVTGSIEINSLLYYGNNSLNLNSRDDIELKIEDNNSKTDIVIAPYSVYLKQNDGEYTAYIEIASASDGGQIVISNDDPLARGITGGRDFTANAKDLDFVQKKYVKEGKGVFTVTTLPTGVLGDKAIVTDATAPTYLGVLVGGGSVTCPVWHNGTNWVSR